MSSINTTSPMELLSQTINASVSPYHCVLFGKEQLKQNGYLELSMTDSWSVKAGGKYYISLFDSTLVAFEIPEKLDTTQIPALRILTSHTDWPTFVVKPHAENHANGYTRLNVEPYGGAIYSTFFDRPLGFAGKVVIKSADPFHPQTVFVDSKEPVCIIPNLAIHMNRDVNDGVKLNAQTDMQPICGLLSETLEQENFFLQKLALLAGCDLTDILDYQIYLYVFEKGCHVGLSRELFSSPRIDNNSSVSALLYGMTQAVPKENVITAAFFYDNEEIGNATKQGADSLITQELLKRLFSSLSFSEDMLPKALYEGLCLSLDVAHAIHPNHPEKCDTTSQITLGNGVALKQAARQSYATDASYLAILIGLCNRYKIAYARFANRSDQRGGSTLGSTLSTRLSMPAVDAGIPLLAMHSARELMAVSDQNALSALTKAFIEE